MNVFGQMTVRCDLEPMTHIMNCACSETTRIINNNEFCLIGCPHNSAGRSHTLKMRIRVYTLWEVILCFGREKKKKSHV